MTQSMGGLTWTAPLAQIDGYILTYQFPDGTAKVLDSPGSSLGAPAWPHVEQLPRASWRDGWPHGSLLMMQQILSDRLLCARGHAKHGRLWPPGLLVPGLACACSR